MECYEIFQQFQAALDAKLESFLSEHKIDSVQMYEACERLHAVDPNCLMCLEYLICHADY